MSFMPLTDSMFLLAESREHPMHVGGLQLFQPPADAGPDYVSDTLEQLRQVEDVTPLFRKRPASPVNSLGNTWWTVENSFDFDYHVRHSAVPSPGRIRELFQMTSRWHGSLLDRHRPLWEMHVVEGLEDGRMALYTKVHHSMVDGVSALRLLQKMLTDDPNKRDCLPPWALPKGASATKEKASFDPLAMLRGGVGVAGEVFGLAPAALRIANQVLREGDITLPRAPKTILNGPVGGARRFAAQSWEIERIQKVAKSSGTTLNDVVMAMVSGSLRTYLLELNALPDEPMTAMVPVSLALRLESAGKDDGKAGNAVGAIVVNLATDKANGPTRLEEISYSAKQAKKILSGLTPMQILAFSAAQMAPIALTPVPGFVKYTRPPFNIVISNVPGPKKQLYWNGAALDGVYPASIVLDGQAVNVTLTSRDKHLDFGIVGCRRSVPHLQRLLTHLETSLVELEQAWG